MVKVQDGQADASARAEGGHQVEKRDGIGAAGNRETQMREAREQAVSAEAVGDGRGDGLRVCAVSAGL